MHQNYKNIIEKPNVNEDTTAYDLYLLSFSSLGLGIFYFRATDCLLVVLILFGHEFGNERGR